MRGAMGGASGGAPPLPRPPPPPYRTQKKLRPRPAGLPDGGGAFGLLMLRRYGDGVKKFPVSTSLFPRIVNNLCDGMVLGRPTVAGLDVTSY